MHITRIFAEVAVSDLERAEAFYTDLFGTGPSTRPMEGMLEWHVDGGGVLQVWVDAARAGGSLTTLVVDAIDGPHETTSFGAGFKRIEDPDGNGITLLAQ